MTIYELVIYQWLHLDFSINDLRFYVYIDVSNIIIEGMLVQSPLKNTIK